MYGPATLTAAVYVYYAVVFTNSILSGPLTKSQQTWSSNNLDCVYKHSEDMDFLPA